MTAGTETPAAQPGSVGEVFLTFLKLGLTSFGGPIAHLGYYRRELVERRGWVGESQFAHLMALCQMLPGPASSQLGFSLGLLRAGWAGALAAFVAFTLPSALLLFAFARLLPALAGPVGTSAIHGLKLVALVVVAHGLAGMARQLCPDWPRAAIALVAVALMLWLDRAAAQLLVVGLGAAAGWMLCRDARPPADTPLRLRYGPITGWCLILIWTLLLAVLPLLARDGDGLTAVAAAFYRAGALVFGGGHAVLPLLEEAVVGPGWLSRDQFLAGYGAAQAVPGPLFSLSAYLGASLPAGHGGLTGAVVALVAIFLPGLLLVSGVLPLWHSLATHPGAARALAGINAAVVGLLGAALYDPVWTTAVRGVPDLLIAGAGLGLLAARRTSALLVVVWCVTASVLVAQ